MFDIGFLTACTLFFGFVAILLLSALRKRVARIEENLENLAVLLEEAGKGTQHILESPAASAATHTPVYTAPVQIQNRQEVVAAISAVIAEDLGTDVQGIRLLSFRAVGQVSSPGTERQKTIAAVAAAIAEDLGTSMQGIRILSFRQV